MNTLPQNNYIRELNACERNFQYTLPRIENGILLCPDGLRWRVETTPKLSDLLHVGDKIRTNYSPAGIIVKLTQFKTCCCPLRTISRTKYCFEAWDEPTAATTKYHLDVFEWSIVFVNENEVHINKDGKIRDDYHFGYINELVAFDSRILKLFENNKDEIFLEDSPSQGKTFQMSLI